MHQRVSRYPHAALLKQLSIPLTEKNQSFIRFLLKEQLPVNKEIFQLASELPKGLNLTVAEAEAVRLLLNKELPLTKSTFQAVLSALKNEPFTPLLEALRSLCPGMLLRKRGRSYYPSYKICIDSLQMALLCRTCKSIGKIYRNRPL